MMLTKILCFGIYFSLFVTLGCSVDWPDKSTQYKGYIEVNETHGVNMFYWFIESRGNPSSDPLVLWLTGGPGCSSMLALLVENGPFLIPDGQADPVFNKYGWNSFANILYVDQPAGTGFSYVNNPLGYETNEKTIGIELWRMLREFYRKYPKYANLDLYLVGESYAGHYIPATAQVIIESSSTYAKNLKAIGIGNGWVDPLIQYQAYSQFAFQHGLINSTAAAVAGGMYKICSGLIDAHLYPVAFFECQLIPIFVLGIAEFKLGRSINVYDIRKKCKNSPLCYDFSRVGRFLNRQDVQADLGVKKKWESCAQLPHLMLLGDWVHEFASATAKVLESGRRVLVYSGKEDYICNYIGGGEWTNATKWSQQSTYRNAKEIDWKIGGELAGQVKAGGGLTFAMVEGAGHMVPMDQPQAALDLLDHLVNNKPFL